MKTTVCCCLLLAIVLLAPAGAKTKKSPNDIFVVVNSSIPVGMVSAETVKAYFLKQQRHWENGVEVVAINDMDNTALRKDFQEKVLKMSSLNEDSYWEAQKIQNSVAPPAELSERLKAVYKMSGGISYIYRSEYKEDVVSVVLVVPAETKSK